MTSRISARLLRLRRGYALLGRLVWACSPAWTVLGVVMSLLQACAAIGIMVGSGRLVQGLILGDLDGTWLAVTLVSLLVQPVAAAAIDVVGTIEQGRATPCCSSGWRPWPRDRTASSTWRTPRHGRRSTGPSRR